MKKIMILLIALIPIVLIFTVQTTTKVVSKIEYIEVESVSFTENIKTVNKTTDEDVVLEFPAKVFPLAATNKNVEYSSSNEDVAVVDETGKITFKDFGKVTITAKSKSVSNIKDSCMFHVTDDKAHRIEITNKISSIIVGESHYLETVIIPIEALNKSVTYSSNNEKVVTVSPDGKLYAVDGGSAEITAITANGKRDSFIIEVIVPVESITIDDEQKSLVTGIGTTKFPQIKFLPINATNQQVIYSSSSSDAVIDKYGNIQIGKAGEYVFTATSVDGNFTVEYKVTYTGGYVISADIKDENKNLNIKFEDYVLNTQLSFDVDVYPTNANMQNVTFVTSNSGVVKVENNKLYIVGGGHAEITMLAYKNATEYVTSKAYINVSRNSTSIEAINVTTNEASVQLVYNVLPNDHTDNISFASSSNLASVSNTGYVQFNGVGVVTITIRTENVQKEIIVEFVPADAKEIKITQIEQNVTVNYLDSFVLSFDDSLQVQVPTFNIDENASQIISYNSSTYIFSAILGGDAVIYVTSNEVSVKVNIKVIRKVSDIVCSSDDVDLSQANIITSKKKVKIDTEILTVDATTKNPTFNSNNTTIAKVNSSGLIEFVKAGEVEITILADEVIKRFKITSTFGLPNSFGLKNSNIVLEDITNTAQIEFTSFAPSDYVYSHEDVIFTAVDNEIVSVDENGTIIALSKGVTTINVQIGELSSFVNVEVKVKTKNVEIAHNAKIMADDYIYAIVGNTIDLDANVYPTNANIKDVVWSVALNDSIAIVDAEGVVTFSGYGEIVVRVTTLDSNNAVYKEITIQRLETPNPDTISVFRGETNVDNGTIKILPEHTEQSPVLNIRITQSNLIDPENINYSTITKTYTEIDTGIVLSIVHTKDNYFTILRTDSKNQSMSATITFAFGNKSVSTTIKFYKITSIQLIYSNDTNTTNPYSDLNCGFEQKRVFGTYSININGQNDTGQPIGEFTNTLNLADKVILSPTGIQDKLYWFCNDSSVVISDGIITFNDPNFATENTEKTITITVGNESAIDQCTVTYSYIMTLVSGACNIFSAADFAYNININHLEQKAMVMHVSVGTSEDTDNTNNHLTSKMLTICVVYNSIYGNGNTINLNNLTLKNLDGSNGINVFIFTKEIRNLTFKGQNNSSSYSNDLVMANGGSVNYCKIMNWKKGLYVDSGSLETKIYRTMFTNTTNCGIQIGEDTDITTPVILEDTLFYNVGLCAIDYQSKKLVIKGFFDVHNYKKYGEVDLQYQTMLKETYESNDFAPYIYKKDDSGNAVSKSSGWRANIGIVAAEVTEGRNINEATTYPKVDTVTFYDENNNEYINSVSTEKLKFARVFGSKTSNLLITKIYIKMYIWTVPVAEAKILPTTTPNQEQLYRLYNT